MLCQLRNKVYYEMLMLLIPIEVFSTRIYVCVLSDSFCAHYKLMGEEAENIVVAVLVRIAMPSKQ